MKPTVGTRKTNLQDLVPLFFGEAPNVDVLDEAVQDAQTHLNKNKEISFDKNLVAWSMGQNL